MYGNCGLVVGGTYTQELKEIRETAPDLPFLVPGVGAQGGNLELVVKNATDDHGYSTLINASRSITYASFDRNFDTVAREKAKQLRDQINRFLSISKNPDLWNRN